MYCAIQKQSTEMASSFEEINKHWLIESGTLLLKYSRYFIAENADRVLSEYLVEHAVKLRVFFSE